MLAPAQLLNQRISLDERHCVDFHPGVHLFRSMHHRFVNVRTKI